MKELIAFFTLFSTQFIFSQTIEGFDFRIADSVAEFYHGADLNDLADLSSKLTKPLDTETEQFRSLFYWVCHNIENDYRSFKRNQNKRKLLVNDSVGLWQWNSKFHEEAMTQLIHEKKTVCTGYAYLLRELCAHAGITCVIVDGFGRSSTSNVHELERPNHSWNAIWLDGEWKLCDATWASGIFYGERNTYFFKKKFNEGYFLTEPRVFAQNHLPLINKWQLVDEVISKQEFLLGPLIYSDAFQYDLEVMKPQQMKLKAAKKEEVIFELKANSSMDVDRLYFIQMDRSKRQIDPIAVNKQDRIELRMTFPKRGNFDLHLYYADEILATFIIDVDRG